MSFKLPEFHITRVREDGTQEEPQVVPVTSVPWDTRMGRRGALGLGAGIAGVVAMLKGSAVSAAEKDAGRTPTHPPVDSGRDDGKTDGLAVGRAATNSESSTRACTAPSGELFAHADGGIGALAITPDGKALVSAGGVDEKVKLWSLPDGKLIATLKGKASINRLAVDRDGDILASGGSPGDSVIIWSLRGRRLLATIEQRDRSVYSRIEDFALSSDGKFLASSVGKTIKLWSIPDGKPIMTLDGHREGVSTLALASDGRILASRSRDQAILWSIPDGKVIAAIDAPGSDSSLSLAPDGKVLATAGWVKGPWRWGVSLWSVPEGKQIATLHPKEYVGAERGRIEFVPDGSALVSFAGSFGKGSIRVWSLPDGKLLGVIKDATTFSVIAGGAALVTWTGGFSRDWCKIWSLPEIRLLGTLQGGRNATSQVAAHDRTLVSAHNNGTGLIWDLTGLVDGTSQPACSPSYLFDPKSTAKKKKGIVYRLQRREDGRTLTFSMPCGSPIPAGATCTCNCVSGSHVASPEPRSRSTGGGGGGSYRICTCVPVYTRSSRRWKANIQPLAGALDQVTRLRGVRFDWTPDAPLGHAGSDLGVVAEEVARVVPEVVARDSAGAPVAVDYARLTAILIEAVKTQQKEITNLRREVDELKTKRRSTRTGQAAGRGR